VAHAYDGRIERKTAMAQFGQSRGDERHRH
jgi:hypothetical protein